MSERLTKRDLDVIKSKMNSGSYGCGEAASTARMLLKHIDTLEAEITELKRKVTDALGAPATRWGWPS